MATPRIWTSRSQRSFARADRPVLSAGRPARPARLRQHQRTPRTLHRITVGSHGMRHRSWRNLDLHARREELTEARQALVSAAAAPVNTPAARRRGSRCIPSPAAAAIWPWPGATSLVSSHETLSRMSGVARWLARVGAYPRIPRSLPQLADIARLSVPLKRDGSPMGRSSRLLARFRHDRCQAAARAGRLTCRSLSAAALPVHSRRTRFLGLPLRNPWLCRSQSSDFPQS